MEQNHTELLLQTERLLLRAMQPSDLQALKRILQDEQVMYAWEHTFTDTECAEWIGRYRGQFLRGRFGYCAATLRTTGEMVGVAGLLEETVGDTAEWGVGYLLRRDCWGRGYAAEAARGCVEEAFRRGLRRVIAEIRPENSHSIRVAQRLGMQRERQFIKHYRGKDMPHELYAIARL